MKINKKYFKLGIASIAVSMVIMIASAAIECSGGKLTGTASSGMGKLSDAAAVIETGNNFIKTGGTVSAVAYYKSKYMSNEEKSAFIEDLAKELGIEYGMEICFIYGKNTDKVLLHKSGAHSDTQIGVVTIKDAGAEKEEDFVQYITYEISIENSPESTCYYADKIRQQLTELGLMDKVTVTIVAYYDGRLEEKERNRLTDRLLQVLGARIVAENRSEELFSVYAYSKGLAGGISVGEEEININIAMNYNEYANQTRLYLAAPIIDMEY